MLKALRIFFIFLRIWFFRKFLWCKGVVSCDICPVGEFQDTVGQDTCKKCKPGTYADNAGFKTCIDCPEGGFCTSTSNTFGDYEACPAGTYNNMTGKSDKSSCISCPKGTFNPSFGSSSSTACESCPSGTFSNSPGKSLMRQINLYKTISCWTMISSFFS